MTCQNTPSILFGGTSLGDSFTTPDAVQSVLSLLESHNIYRIDTAGRYPPINPGRSEQLLRETKAADQGFTIDTKILARVGDGSGELTREKIEESLKESLERLGVAKINILHIHRSDPQTPLEEQAAALDALYKEGKFAALGVSNFRPETLRAFLAVCEENAFIKPTVYQGDYSLINRGMEKHLLPLLREHGMVFNAFRSIAAGFFSGSVTSGNKEGTRFGDKGYVGQYMNKLYDNESLNEAQRKLAGATEELGITPIEAALRWVVYHSALGDGDGVILGASKEVQIEK
jgi:aflatoxin B1 aldehyde reductase